MRRERYPPATWLRKLTSPLVYGEKVCSHVFPKKNKEELVHCYNSFGFVPHLRNDAYRAHAAGGATYYFQGNTWGNNTLVLIDIDVQKAQKRGTTEGAIQFVNYLKRHLFRTLYWEMSTNGKGVHAYIVVDKTGVSARHVNNSLKAFQQWLCRHAQGFDIELVEVKGHCPEIVQEGKTIRAMQFGSMAKLPRALNTHFHELQKTPVINWLALRNMPDDVPVPRVVLKAEPANGSPRSLVSVGNREKKPKIRAGSTTGKNISEEDLASLPRYELLADRYLGGEILHAGRHVVTTRDFAIGFLLLTFFKKNRNADGSLPTARVRGLWEALYEEGDVDRPWNHNRWKVIRDAMSQWGLLTWHDNRYQPGCFLGQQWHPGQACKWEITDEFAEELEQGDRGASFVNTGVNITLDWPRPKRVWNLICPPHRRLDRYLAWAHGQLSYQMAA